MRLVNKQEMENLFIVYKNLHYENWQRGQNIWVVNSVLITGSLIVASSNIKNFSSPLMSLSLVVTAFIAQATTEQVTIITYEKMEEVGEDLGLTEPKGNV